MKKREMIYLQYEDNEVTWCQDKINESDVAYLRNDIAKKEIAELKKQITNKNSIIGSMGSRNLKLDGKLTRIEKQLEELKQGRCEHINQDVLSANCRLCELALSEQTLKWEKIKLIGEKERSERFFKVLEEVADVCGTANRSSFNQIKQAVNDSYDISYDVIAEDTNKGTRNDGLK